jgi:hypothetical protein
MILLLVEDSLLEKQKEKQPTAWPFLFRRPVQR